MNACRKPIAAAMLLLLSIVVLTGCWNSNELSDMAIVVGIGVDKDGDSGKYRVSMQIVNPSTVAANKSSGGGQNAIPNIVYSSVDHTLFSAFRKTSQKAPRRLFFAHSQMFVIGEPLAREGINGLFDLFERSRELRLTSSVVIARGMKAEDLLNILTPMQTTTATSIKDKLEVTSEVWAQNVDTDVTDIIKKVSGSGEPAISGAKAVGNPIAGRKKANLEETPPQTNIETKGIAIFAQGKLAAWLDGKAARGAVWAMNKMKSTTVNLDCGNEKQAIAIEVIRSSTRTRVHMRNGKPVLTMHIKEEGNLTETNCPLDPSNRELIVKLQNQLAEATKKEVETAIKAAQSKKSDIFGFSTEMERTQPKAWKQLEKSWPDVFAETEVEINVEAYIRRTGLRIKSYIKPEKE
ncbi:Ger(x)C family spore germination protein [Paenibacillus sp. N4]|uniref:Ger(x)C family spore germination protein n=1 Tax=Paenibacillus vietnamensis TaxID=2590547 RepID=UPI001CD088E1|nr:Ger(x)C family spore germination protein [Paenibacillus vietnamensis]MCA0758488.1 Ger(x)C family spore germination protein [Paenibacillus vietnamensis]